MPDPALVGPATWQRLWQGGAAPCGLGARGRVWAAALNLPPYGPGRDRPSGLPAAPAGLFACPAQVQGSEWVTRLVSLPEECGVLTVQDNRG